MNFPLYLKEFFQVHFLKTHHKGPKFPEFCPIFLSSRSNFQHQWSKKNHQDFSMIQPPDCHRILDDRNKENLYRHCWADSPATSTKPPSSSRCSRIFPTSSKKSASSWWRFIRMSVLFCVFSSPDAAPSMSTPSHKSVRKSNFTARNTAKGSSGLRCLESYKFLNWSLQKETF